MMSCFDVPKSAYMTIARQCDVEPLDRVDAGQVAVGHCRWHEDGKDRRRCGEFRAQKRRTERLDERNTGHKACNASGRSVCLIHFVVFRVFCGLGRWDGFGCVAAQLESYHARSMDRERIGNDRGK